MKNIFPWLAPIEVKHTTAHFWERSKDLIHLTINYQNFSGLDENCRLEIEDIALCDLQRGIGATLEKSLGSGRSCFYKGLYFKGIGRTPLVKSWAKTEDILHSNGLLLPSGAIREVAFSLFVKKISHSINPVLSLSLTRGTIYSQKVVNKLYLSSDVDADKIESSYIAQTVKQGNFIRFSNIRWLIGNLGTYFVNQNDLNTLEFLISCIDHGLQKNSHDSLVIRTYRSPRLIFKELFDGVITAIKNVIELNTTGVKLGSLGNNFALDGRFIDLEVPVFVGSHQLCTHLLQDRHALSEIFECLGPLFQYRLYLEEFGQWLKNSRDNSPFPKASTYLQYLHDEFQQESENYRWLWEEDKVINFIRDCYLYHKIQISQKALILIKMALRNPYLSLSLDDLGKNNQIAMNFPHYQTGISTKCFAIPGLIESSSPIDLQNSTLVNDCLINLKNLKSHEEIFSELTKLDDKLNR